MEGSAHRQYEGFGYPTSYFGTPPRDGAPPPPAAARGGGLTKRSSHAGTNSSSTPTTTPGAAAPPPTYNYFHQHTNSTGGGAQSVYDSETASSTSNPHHYRPLLPVSAPLLSPHLAPTGGATRTSPSPFGARVGPLGSESGASASRAPASNDSATVFMSAQQPTAAGPLMSRAGPSVSHSASSNGGLVNVHSGSHVFYQGDGRGTPASPTPMPFLQSPPRTTTPNAGAAQAFVQPPPPSPLVSSGPAGATSGPPRGGLLGKLLHNLLDDPEARAWGGGVAGMQTEPQPLYQRRFGHPEDDLPLHEELGIFPRHIIRKALVVLNPFGAMPMESVEDTDLAGPVLIAILLASLLSLQGRIQFSAIYGLSVLGVTFSKVLLSLMNDKAVPLQFVISSLGYALIPNVLLAVLRTLQFWLFGAFNHTLLALALIVVMWSSWCATALMAKGLGMERQRYLILYPMFLFYSVFATLTIF